MDKNIEIEFKALLTKEQYETMLEMFKGIEPYTQINHYFDTKDGKLIQKRNSLRVRFKNDAYEFTLKQPGKVGLNEYNEMISEEAFLQLKKQIPFKSEILGILNREGTTIEEIVPYYSLKTVRYDLPYKDGLLSLDYNEYLDVQDYELEYEANSYDEGLKIYLEIMKKLGIQYNGNCPGKRHRVQNRINTLAQNKQ